MKTWTTPAGTRYTFHTDLLAQKHLMIAGASGSGKSVLLNGIIYNALYSMPGDSARTVLFILIDKKGVELGLYKHLPHTIRYAITDEEAEAALRYAEAVISYRFQHMERLGVRTYPGGDMYIIIDEFADLMTTNKKRVTPLIQRISQLGRAAKVHIILCTQCPLAAILPTTIKVNFDSIVGLHTANAQQSRNIIGVKGCENLKIGECYYIKPGVDLMKYEDIPLFPDEVLIDRVNWWTNQNAPQFIRKPGLLSRIFKKTA